MFLKCLASLDHNFHISFSTKSKSGGILLTTNWYLRIKQYVGKAVCGLAVLLYSFSNAFLYSHIACAPSEMSLKYLLQSTLAHKISILLLLYFRCSEVNIISYWVYIFPCTYTKNGFPLCRFHPTVSQNIFIITQCSISLPDCVLLK